jgi:hypothetical protein
MTSNMVGKLGTSDLVWCGLGDKGKKQKGQKTNDLSFAPFAGLFSGRGTKCMPGFLPQAENPRHALIGHKAVVGQNFVLQFFARKKDAAFYGAKRQV